MRHDGETDPGGLVSPSDAELVVQLRARDAHALTTLFKRYFAALVRFVYSLIKSEDGAEDIVQDVFIRIWDHPEALNPAQSLKGYLYTAVRNAALNEQKYTAVRMRHREATQADAAADPTVYGTANPENAIIQYLTLERALSQLSDRRAQAIRLRMHEQMTYAEIGEILGVSTTAAEHLVLRGLDDLRKFFRVAG